MTILDRFMIALGFQVDPKGINEFEEQTAALKATALRLGAVLTGAAVGVGLFVHEVSEGMDKVYEFSEINKVAAKAVEALQLAGMDYGITQDEMTQGLSVLNRRLGEAAANIGRGHMLFQRLGLSAKDSSGHVRSLWEMLDVLSTKMQGKSRAENVAIGARFGMDPKMVLMLEQGPEALKKMREQAELLVPFEEEDYLRAHKVDIAFAKAKYTAGLLARVVAVQLMPVVQNALDWFIKWFHTMRTDATDRLTVAFKLMGAVIGTLWDWTVRAVTALTKLIGWLDRYHLVTVAAVAITGTLMAYKIGTWFMGLASAIGTATKALRAFDFSLALPIAGIVLLALGIGLIIDDLVNYYNGNDSVIGQLKGKFRDAVALAWLALGTLSAIMGVIIWKQLAAFVLGIRGLATDIIGLTAKVWGLVAAKAALLWEVTLVIVVILALIGIVYMLWTRWGSYMSDIKRWWHQLGDYVTGFTEKVREALYWTRELLQNMTGKDWLMVAKGLIDHDPSEMAMGFSGGMRGGSTLQNYSLPSSDPSRFAGGWQSMVGPTVHITAPVHVMTSDPDKAGQNVHDYLERKHRDVVRNAQTAVSH